MITKELGRLNVLRDQGDQGIASLKRGKPSNRKISKSVKDSMIDLIYTRYTDYGPTLAHEKLIEEHKFTISVSTVRNIMIEEELWIPKKVKRRDFYLTLTLIILFKIFFTLLDLFF